MVQPSPVRPVTKPALASSDAVMVEEELQWLERVLAAIAARPPASRASPDRTELRGLRDEAMASSDDDLPAALHELAVRHRLATSIAPPSVSPASPYVAHLRILEGDLVMRDVLLGAATFIDAARGVRIVSVEDTPMGRIFARHREGDAFEEQLPGRTLEGRILARRILDIRAGRLERIRLEDRILERGGDDRWSRIAVPAWDDLGGAAARPGRLVSDAGALDEARVELQLDEAQRAAIASPAEVPLLVLGSAGSGKTTVALHRMVRVARDGEPGHALAVARVIVPEEGLARLSRRLLEPLGGAPAQVQTLDDFAIRTTREVFGRRASLSREAPGVVVALKRHPALFRALRTRFARTRRSSPTLPRLRARLGTCLSDRTFLAGVIEDAGGTLSRAAIEETVRHTMLQLAEPIGRMLADITDPSMKRAVDGRGVGDDTPDALGGTVDVEDLPILLFLRGLVREVGPREIGHVVLDEAEDASLFDLFVIGKLLHERGAITLAGDEAQQTLASFAGWDASLAELGATGAARCRLDVSYRCPRPITEIAHAILGPLAPAAPPIAAREGPPIEVSAVPTELHARLVIASRLRALIERAPGVSACVIASDEATARRFFTSLADLPEARLVLRGEHSFEPGIDVTDVDSVKGLEFDVVVIPDATQRAYPETDDARRRLHVAVTRSACRLWMVSAGPVSPLIARAEDQRS